MDPHRQRAGLEIGLPTDGAMKVSTRCSAVGISAKNRNARRTALAASPGRTTELRWLASICVAAMRRRAAVVGLNIDVAKRRRADTTQPKPARGLGDTGHEAEFWVGGV